MSLIVTVCTGEGIVLASDSRSTYNRTEQGIIQFGVHYSDSTYKTFSCGNIGISTCGDGTICGKSIAGHIENFINNAYSTNDTVEECASKLLRFFNDLSEKSSVIFHVAGYKKEDDLDKPIVYYVNTLNNMCKIISDGICGANWNGESAVLTRLMKNSYVVSNESVVYVDSLSIASKQPDGSEIVKEYKNQLAIPADSQQQPECEIAWNLMTLQDGIEFAQFAIKTTMDSMKFQTVPKTVGGPIDILVLKPNGSQWIQRKELHA